MEEETIYKTESRRSVDWRDSGIVIDDDDLFDSVGFEDFPKFTNPTTTNLLPTQPSNGFKLFNDYMSDPDGDTILHIAVVGFSLDKVRDLVKICDLNAVNTMMQTPLHVATMANRKDMVDLLIQSGAQINIHDRRGNTPLHLACQKGFTEIAMVILNSIDKVNAKKHLEMTNFDGLCCLHLAALQDQRQIISLLVTVYGANINCHDSKSGATIMHNSISAYNVDLIGSILSYDKHCNEPDFYGRTPLKTIKILINSTTDSTKALKLTQASRMVHERIKWCIRQGGCCTEEQYKIDNSEMSDSSSSSGSDYSDTDS